MKPGQPDKEPPGYCPERFDKSLDLLSGQMDAPRGDTPGPEGKGKGVAPRLRAVVNPVPLPLLRAFASQFGKGAVESRRQFISWLRSETEGHVRRLFLEEFAVFYFHPGEDGDTGLRVCGCCGRFMTEGYWLDGENMV